MNFTVSVFRVHHFNRESKVAVTIFRAHPCYKKSKFAVFMLGHILFTTRPLMWSFIFHRNIYSTRAMHRTTDAKLFPPERQLTKVSEPLFDLEGVAKGQI